MIRWRLYRKSDGPALRAIEAKVCGDRGEAVRIKDMDDPLLVRVLVAEEDGKVVGALVAKATVEMFAVGGNAKLFHAAVRDQFLVRQSLQSAGVGEVLILEDKGSKLAPIFRHMGVVALDCDVFYGVTK
jgi:predicted N-acetyltransferase YhbS